MGDEMAARLGEILEDERLLRQPTGLLRLLPLAGEYEDRLRPDRVRRLKVLQTVADRGNALQLDVEARRDLLEHAGARLAARAFLDGGVRAEEERVDAPALAEDELHHLVVDRVQRQIG